MWTGAYMSWNCNADPFQSHKIKYIPPSCTVPPVTSNPPCFWGHFYGKPFWTKAVEFSSDGRDFSRTVEIFLGRSRFSSDGRDFSRTVEIFLGRSRFFSDGRDFKFSRTVENTLSPDVI